MSIPEGSHARKVDVSFEKLSDTAINLNSASRRLNEAIDQLNAALKQLNLGIPAWVSTCSHEEGQIIDSEEIGYARVKGRWGICIRRTIEGLGPDPDETEWHFDDAPRDLRIRNIPFLDKVIEKLNDVALETAQKIGERAGDAEELASAISAIAEKARPAKKNGGKQ
jgi:methyl-accepting chemotaxis protein